MVLQRIEQGAAPSIDKTWGINHPILETKIHDTMNDLMDRVNETAGAKIHDSTRDGRKNLNDSITLEAPSAESQRVDQMAGAKFSSATGGNIAHKMMDHYIKMVEIICKLKAVKLDGINELIDKVNESLGTERYWTNNQGWADLAFGFGGGALKIGSSFFGDSSVAKIMDGISQFSPQLANTSKTFMQAINLDPQLKKNMIVNIKLPQANEKMRSYGESLKEANQHLEQLMQLLKQAKTKINQG